MTSLLASRAARRRGIAFAVLLVISVMLMAFSSNPGVRELQNGVSFAFRPIQGALDEVARGAASVAAAVSEIDRLRVDNAALYAENQRLAAENARLEEIRRENESLTALLQLRAGLDYKTVATTVIARESSEFRRLVVLDKGTGDGIAVGDVVVAAGGALAGRVTEVGPASAKVVLLTDAESTVIGQLTGNAATGEVVGQLGGVLIMRQIDAGEKVAVGDEVVTADRAGGGVRRRTRRACSSVRSSTSGRSPTTWCRPRSSSRPRSSTSSSTCWSSPTTRVACRRSSSSRSTAVEA